MTYWDIEYEFIGDKALIQKMRAAERRADNLKPVFEFARDELRKANSANFSGGGLPAGGWKPLDAQYGAWKAVHFPGAPPMVQTGKLFRDLVTLRGSENVITENYAQFGTSVEYAKFHQYGTRKMAPRKIVFEPAGFSSDVGGYAAAYIIEGETVSLMFGGI